MSITGVLNARDNRRGKAMIDRPDDATWFIMLILIASITGAIGGCAGAAHIFLTSDKPIRAMQVVAYGIIGLFLGLLSFGLLAAGKHFGLLDITSVEAMIGFSLSFGFAGTLILSGTNIIIYWTTKHFGKWELKFTARQDHLERRGKRPDDD